MREPGLATLADVEEFEKLPLDVRLKCSNTYEMIKRGASLDPEALALSFIPSGEQYANPMQVTYREFITQVNRAANLFHDLGVGPRDVISYILPNLPKTYYIYWGGEAAGIVNPINYMLEPSAIRDMCKAVGTKVLVALGECHEFDIWQKLLAIRRDLPDLKTIIRITGPGDEKEGILGFDEVITGYNGGELDSGREIAPDDIASILHTGGTTGTPKLTPRNHLNEISMTLMIETLGALKKGEAVLAGLPLFHNYGLMGTGLLPLSIGAHIVLLSPLGYRDPSIMQNFYKIVEQYQAVVFAAVPTLLSTLLEIAKEDANISSLRLVVSGAAPLSVELCQRFEAHVGVKVLEGYGLTEGTSSSSMNPLFGERKVGSIGLRWPYQEMKIFIVDEEGRFIREAGTNEIGAVCIKGPNVFRGYLDQAHNRGIWPKEDWLNTGDLGRQDPDGYFWITGRKKELIIRGGHNIDPAVIEESLYQLPEVQLAAAVGRPDPRVGEMPVAYVQLMKGSGLTPEQILDHLKNKISERAAIPKDAFVLDEMPLTSVGKVSKSALQRDAIKRVCQAELDALGDMADSVEVKVTQHKLHGSLATLTIKAAPEVSGARIKDKVNEILAPYAVKYRLEL